MAFLYSARLPKMTVSLGALVLHDIQARSGSSSRSKGKTKAFVSAANDSSCSCKRELHIITFAALLFCPYLSCAIEVGLIQM